MSGKVGKDWAVRAGFAALCLLAGSRWLVDTAVPSSLPTGVRATLHFGLIAAALALFSLRHPKPAPSKAGWIALAGGLLFALAATELARPRPGLSGVTVELAFLLLPVGTLFTLAQAGSPGAAEGARSLLLPVLAGLGGAMLLLPWSTPSTAGGWAALALLCGAVLLAGGLVVSLHGLLQRQAVLPAAALVAVGAAVLSAVSMGWHRVIGLTAGDWLAEAAVALLFDGPLLLLGVWCLRELAPMRFVSRPLLSLLAAVGESFLATRPDVAGLQRWTMLAGALLMGASATLMWREGAAE